MLSLIVHELIEGKLSLETSLFSIRLLVVSLSSELQNQTLLIIATSLEKCAALVIIQTLSFR